MFDKIRSIFTANRVAAFITLVGAVAAFIASLETSLVPGSPAAEALGKAGGMIASLLVGLRVVEKFLEGSQNWDSLMQAGVPKAPGVTVVQATNEFNGDTPDDDFVELGVVPMSGPGADDPDALAGFRDDSDDMQSDAEDANEGDDPGNPPIRPA